MHAPLLVQLPEIRIAQVFDEPYRFAGAFHFWAQFFVHAGEFIE
jgi:hypothetical protein